MVPKLFRGQRGFTLIELVAVMAILAILVAIVAPAAINSERASITAQAQADSPQVRNAASQFFTKQNESEVRTPHTVGLTTDVNDETNVAPLATPVPTPHPQQVVSSRWPELFITQDTYPPGAGSPKILPGRSGVSKYEDVFPTGGKPGRVVNVTLKDKTGTNLSGTNLTNFLANYTAIDLKTLVDEGLLNKMPDGVDKTSATGIGTPELKVPNFLWLFKKQSSSLGGTGANDDRSVAVFTLVKVEQIEPSSGGALLYVQLTYEQILGP